MILIVHLILSVSNIGTYFYEREHEALCHLISDGITEIVLKETKKNKQKKQTKHFHHKFLTQTYIIYIAFRRKRIRFIT